MNLAQPAIPEALGISLLGMCVVFVVLIFLMCVIYIMSAVLKRIARKPAAAAPEGPQQAPAPTAAPTAPAEAPVSAAAVSAPPRQVTRGAGVRKYRVVVDGEAYDVEAATKDTITYSPAPAAAPMKAPAPVKAPAPPPAAPAPAPAQTSAGEETVAAPMPGTVLSVNVSVGDTVRSGQVLLILEAMKMENEIFSPRDGKVTSVAAAKGAVVNAGDALIILG